MKRSQLIIMIILITISLGVNSWILGQELQINAKNQSPIKSIQYEDHSPILIDGNANFIAATTIEGWPGEGTPSSPYVIDGINITGPEDIHLIEIRNTDVYFQITNCSLTGGKRGIIFDNVKHSEISNNTVFNNGKHPTGHGIYLQNSGNITLVNNTVTNNPTYGVYLQNSENITLLKNTIINNGWLAGMAAGHGIYLRDSVNINLSTNLIINNGVNGIYLQNSGNNMISDNILVNDSLFLSGDLDDWLQAVVTNNSVNGKPLVYWQNVNGGTVPSNAGQVILVNSNSVEVAGQKLLGVQGAYCSNLSIRRNNISDSYRGIDLTSTNNSSLAGNNITYCSGGIFLMNSNNNILSNNTITNNGIANFWGFSDNNTLSSNFVDNNGDYGIRIYSSGNSTLFNNTFTNNDRWGINIDSSENSTLSNNLVVNNRGKSTWYQSYGGISIYRSGNNSLSDNNVSNNEGFGISSSGVISFSGNNVTKNGDFGVSITGAGSCSVINNRVLNNNGDGIRIGGAGSISVINNAAENNGGSGIRISGAGSSSIDKNLITNNHGLGIALSSSGNNNIRNNTLWNNILHVSGSLEECLQAIVTNNSVNGKPLMYQQNNTGGTILDGSSQIILVNSNSIEVSDQNLMGVQGAFCSNLSIHNNNFSKGYYGIALEATVNSTLSNNTITDNSLHGIYLRESDNNNLENNEVTFNGGNGIYLENSENNTILRNYVANSTNYGIYLSYCEITRVMLNYLSGNNIGNSQGRDYGGALSTNIFAFNTWDEWTSPDSNEDGIVDLPYALEGSGWYFDVFPLVEPGSHVLTVPTVEFPHWQDTLTGIVTIQWMESVDSWGHTASYNVYYSADGGTTWVLLEADLTTTSYVWNTAMVADDTNYLIKIIATCHENLSNFDISDYTFTIDNVAPIPTTTPTTTEEETTTSTDRIITTTPTSSSSNGTTGWGVMLLILTLMFVLRQRKEKA